MKIVKKFVKVALIAIAVMAGLGAIIQALESPAQRAARLEKRHQDEIASAERAKQADAEKAARVEKAKQEHILFKAKYNARDFVAARLKSPKTAEFAGIEEMKAWDLGGGQYKAVGYVDSQNGFGAMTRTRFAVTMASADGEHFGLVKLATD